MSQQVFVATADELPPGERTLVATEEGTVGVFNVDGEYYAVANECAHQHGPVCTGKVSKKLVGEMTDPGEFDEEHFVDSYTISCPWHGWEYDLETGEHLGDSDHGIPSYDVVVEDDGLYVVVE